MNPLYYLADLRLETTGLGGINVDKVYLVHLRVNVFLPLVAIGNCLWRDLASTMIWACLFKKPLVGTSSSSSVAEATSAVGGFESPNSGGTFTGIICSNCKHSSNCHCCHGLAEHECTKCFVKDIT